MANPSKRKGTTYEVLVCDYLRHNGFPYAERRALSGSSDKGDVAGIPGLVLELKAAKKLELSKWMAELRAEKENAHASAGAVVIKRRNHAVGKSYVVMELEDYVKLVL